MPELVWKERHHPDVQKILGSHANGKGEMKNLYTRGSLTWPVNLLGMVIQEIKWSKYDPDLCERPLQLKPEVYANALSGGSFWERSCLN